MTMPLGECCRMLNGGTPSKLDASFWNGTIPFITSADIADSKVTRTRFHVTDTAIKESAARIIKPGTVLLVTRTGVGKAAIADRPMAYSQDITALVPSPKVDPRYLLHFLRKSEGSLAAAARGATIKGITREVVATLRIPLPPLPEQRRIAATLDQADALRAKRRTAIAKLDSLAQSIFLDMFGDPIKAPRNRAQWVPVSHFVDRFETGRSLVSEDEADADCPYRVLKISAVTTGEFIASESKAVPRKYDPPSAHFVRPGDLLFSRANTSELVGATAYVFEAPNNLLLPDKLWRFVWHQPARVDPLFVWYLFRHPSVRFEITKRATGSSGSMKNIGQDKVLAINIALPSLAEQKTFSQLLTSARKIYYSQNFCHHYMDSLCLSLQELAFK